MDHIRHLIFCCGTALPLVTVFKILIWHVPVVYGREKARYGIRVNAILPGLMETPNAIETVLESSNISREELIRMRDEQIPLLGKQGTAWDVANAALFLASNEARFITGVLLPVDGGLNLKRG